MLSCLSRGIGSWSGDLDYDVAPTESFSRTRKCKSALPRLSGNADGYGPHRHGITVTPTMQYRAKTAVGTLRAASPDGQIALPKTYLTRKGALMLFSSPGSDEYDPLKGFPQNYPTSQNTKGDNLIDLSLNIGTLQRLTLSVLQYGDKSFDPATSSVTDFDNRLFLKFLKTLPKNGWEEKIQPGGDLSFYLERLKSTTNVNRFTRLSTPDVAELKSALDALDQSRTCTPVLDNSPPVTGELNLGRLSRPGTAPLLNRRHRSARSGVLSSKKLASSLKSSKLIDRSGPPAPPITLAWVPGADSIQSKDEASTTVSDVIRTDESVKGTSGTSLVNQTGVISELQGEKTLEKSSKINLVKNSSIKSNTYLNSSESEINNSDENRSTIPQELSPVFESPEFTESAVFQAPTPQTPNVDHNPEENSPLPHSQPIPSLLEILTTSAQDVDGETGEEVFSSEQQDACSIASASLPDLEEQDIDLPQETADVHSDSRQEFKRADSSQRTSSPKSPFDQNQDCASLNEINKRDSPSSQAWGIDPIIVPAYSPTSFSGDRTSILRTSSPIERPVPACSPVDFAQEGFEEKTPNFFGENYEKEMGDLEKTDASEMLTPCDTMTVRVPPSQVSEDSIISSKLMEENVENQTTQLSNQMNDNLVDEEALLLTPGASKHVTKATNQTTLEPGESTFSERDIDRAFSGTPVSELSEFKELFTNETSSETRPTLHDHTQQGAHPRGSELHITPYQSGEIPARIKNVKEPITQEEDFVKGHPEVKDAPFTSKSSLRSIRSRSSLPVSPPPPPHPTSPRADRPSPSPPPANKVERISSSPSLLSPKPPAGAPPTQRSRPIRRGSPKESTEIRRGPPSPDTLVRTLSADVKTNIKPQSAPKSRGGSAATKRNKRPKTGKKMNLIDEDAERLRLDEKDSAKKKLEMEVKVLEQHIRTKEKIRQEQLEQAEKLRRDYQFQMDALQKEAAELRQAEEDAKATMAMTRQSQREVRELQRKAELERKQLLAIQNREREKKMMEGGRIKEHEMLESIADAEMRTNLVEKMERNRDEEERLAQERFEEEMREAQQLAEEQEERMRYLENEAEEEAMQRLLTEQEKIEKKRRSLLQETQKLDEEDEKLKQEIEKEQQILDEELHQIELKDLAMFELEAARLKEINKREAAEKDKKRREICNKQLTLAKQRRKNHDMHMSLEQVRNSQGVTRPYIYSYFLTWPREIYEKPMGGDSKKKRAGIRPKPKSAK